MENKRVESNKEWFKIQILMCNGMIINPLYIGEKIGQKENYRLYKPHMESFVIMLSLIDLEVLHMS